MIDPVRELKTRAEILHKKFQAGFPGALSRLRALPEYRRATEDRLREKAASIQRRDCLSIVAAELGFPNWPSAKAALAGDSAAEDFGTLLYPDRAVHINIWFRSYEEAAAVREERQGFLLAYKRQYFVADRYLIESLGLDPDDADWREIGFNWVRPGSPAARTRLYAKLIARLPRESVTP